MSALRWLILFILSMAACLSLGEESLALEVRTASGERLRLSFFVNGIPSDAAEEVLSGLNGLVPSQLAQKLIQDLARSQKYRNIAVYSVGQSESAPSERWVIEMEQQRLIYEVSIDGVTFLDESRYKRALVSRPGRVFLENVIEEDVLILKRMLSERGYPNSQVVRVQVRAVANGDVRLDFIVERGELCRLAEVVVEGSDNLLDVVSLPIELGAACNLPDIRKRLQTEQERLRSEGYLQARLELKDIVYSEDKTRALLNVLVERGQRTVVEAFDLSTGQIRQNLFEGEQGFSPFDLSLMTEEDLRREILNLYLEDGYARVEVRGPTAVELKSGSRALRYYVDKGTRITIGDVEFTGDRLPIPTADALSQMELDPGVFSQSIPYFEGDLPLYQKRLVEALYLSGYGDAAVAVPRVFLSRSGGTAKLSFEVKLNKRYLLGELIVTGRPSEVEIDRDELNEVLNVDDPVSGASIEQIKGRAKRQLIDAGYYYAQVSENVKVISESEAEKSVQLLLQISSGPQVRIGSIYAEGEFYGKSERVKVVSGIQRGDIFSPARLERARLRLLRHELLGNVSIEVFDRSAIERKEDVLDVVIRATGRSGYSLELSPGYGTRNGYRFSTDFLLNELNESGTRLTLSSEVSQDKQQIPIGLSTPELGRKLTVSLVEPLLRVGNWISPFDVRTVFGVEVSNRSYEARFFETYQVSGIYRPEVWELGFDLELGFAHEWSQIIAGRIEPLEALNNPSLQIHELFFRFGLDTRDSPEWPRRGLLLEALTQHARFGLDSDVSFDRLSVATSVFLPLLTRWSHVFSLGYTEISDVLNRKSETVTAPGSRRASLVGKGLIRGFPENGRPVGPLVWLNFEEGPDVTQADCPSAVRAIGATNMIYAKYELRYRTQYLSDMLGVAWFVDTGAAYFDPEELRRVQNKISERIDNQGYGDLSCQVEDARLYQSNPVSANGAKALSEYLDAAFVTTGIGIRFIVPNFAAISLDWGVPLLDPATNDGDRCLTIDQAEGSDVEPLCIKRDRQEKLFGAIPVPGSLHLGIGANL